MSTVIDVLRTVWLKKHGAFPTFARINVTIPAGSTVGATIWIPDNRTWLVLYELRGNFPYESFTETCRKDGKDIFPRNVAIGREQIDFPIAYAVPWLVEESIEYSATNLTENSLPYDLTMYYAEIDKEFLDLMKRYVNMLEETQGIMMEIWGGMNKAEKIAYMKRNPFWLIL